MLRHFVLATGITIISGLTSVNASAETCDGLLSWLCQGSDSAKPAPEFVQQDPTKRKVRATAAVDQAKRDVKRKQRNGVRPAMTPKEKETLFREFLDWQTKRSASNPEE